MTRGRWFLMAIGLLLFGGWYVSVGVGYERLQRACFDSRHSIDQEGYVGEGLGVVMWPLFLPVTGKQSCLPVPLGEVAPTP
jgi:hypothetical protein